MAPQLSLGVQSRGTPEGLGILLLLLDNILEIPGRSQVGPKVPGTLIYIGIYQFHFISWLAQLLLTSYLSEPRAEVP